MKRLWLLPPLLALASAAAAVAAPFNVFADGESFTYKVSWAVFPGAGRIVIAAHDETLDGVPVVRITVDTSSRGLVRIFYSYNDRAVAIVDRATGRILTASDKGGGGKEASDSTTTFDYAARQVTHVNRAKPSRDRTFALPPGDPIDLISCLIDTRTWDVKPGDQRDALVYFDDDVYPVTITAMDYETVYTALGTFKALRLEPAMTHDAKGIFARQGQIQVWVSQDTPRLPVKMQLHLKLGTATLTLIKHDPGNATPPGR
jgi:Protein of unknown function (DUF3108)